VLQVPGPGTPVLDTGVDQAIKVNPINQHYVNIVETLPEVHSTIILMKKNSNKLLAQGYPL